MFTGIVEEIGKIISISSGGERRIFRIKCSKVLQGVLKGDSISVNGVCLTVREFARDYFDADVMNETVKSSAFAGYKRGDEVNLERALQANSRLGGHIVSGHVDCIGTVLSKKRDGNAIRVWIGYPIDRDGEIIKKGSVSVDGISLTVMNVEKGKFELSIIPTTSEETVLLKRNIGDRVNLEFDIVGKYIKESIIKEKGQGKTSNITMDFLRDNGFC